jgi:hypothetical protein
LVEKPGILLCVGCPVFLCGHFPSGKELVTNFNTWMICKMSLFLHDITDIAKREKMGARHVGRLIDASLDY